MSILIRTERGWPAHYCCGSRCVFHRNTLLQCGDLAVVVSTVGDLRLSAGQITETIEEIGAGRYYETAAFPAMTARGYLDADTSRPIRFDAPWALPSTDDCRQWGQHAIPHEADAEANAMHEAVVEEISARMLAGVLAIPPQTDEDKAA